VIAFTVLEFLARAIRQTKRIQIGKEEMKLYLFKEDMILCLDDPKDSTEKILLGLIKKIHFWKSSRI
jgi:hypothetical protein